MANSVARHSVQLIADTSQFEQGIMSATTALARFQKAQQAAVGGVAGLGGSSAQLSVSQRMAQESQTIARAQAKLFDNLGLRLPEQARDARDAFQAFNQVFDETGQKLQYAMQANTQLTAAQNSVSRSARESAAAMQEVWREQEKAAQAAQQLNNQLARLRQQGQQITQQSKFQQANPFKQQVLAVQQLNQLLAQRRLLDRSSVEFAEQELEIRRKIAQVRAIRSSLTAGPEAALRNQKGLFEAGSKAASLYGMRLQGVGYQVQDFIVQVGAGQSALVAFAQQGSQLLSVLGGWKFALAGAGLALTSVVAQIILATRKTEEQTEQFKTQEEATKDLKRSFEELAVARLKAVGDEAGAAKLNKFYSDEEAQQLEANVIKLESELASLQGRIESLTARQEEARRKEREGRATGDSLVVLGRTLNSVKEEEAKKTKELTERVAELNRAKRQQQERNREEYELWSSNLRKMHEEGLRLLDREIDLQKERSDQEQQSAAQALALSQRVEATKKRMADLVASDIKNSQSQAQAIRETINPQERLLRLVKEAQSLADRGFLNAEEVVQYRKHLEEASKEQTNFSKLMVQTWREVSDRAGQAFADMVLSGENAFKRLADIVARAALEITARMAIINPILNMVFGGTNGWDLLPAWFGKGKSTATGGSIWSGETRMVGENGPELITAEKAGRIYSSSKTRQMTTPTQAGPVFHISYSFQGGVTPADLARALPSLVKTTKASIWESQQRWQPA